MGWSVAILLDNCMIYKGIVWVDLSGNICVSDFYLHSKCKVIYKIVNLVSKLHARVPCE